VHEVNLYNFLYSPVEDSNKFCS